MAIQRINLGTAPSGTGGDTNRSAFKKIDDNFADTTNAASRQVGTAAGNVMEVGAFGFGKGIVLGKPNTYKDATNNELAANQIIVFSETFGYPLGISISYGVMKNFIGFTAFGQDPVYITLDDSTKAPDQRVINSYSFRTTKNTSVDPNGFIKNASPIISLYADKIELNDEAKQQKITLEKIGVGDYLVKGSLGFAQEGWYIEMPKDANGNVLVAVVYEQLANNDISVKTYDYMLNKKGRIVPDLETPLDIPETRWIDLRLQALPQPDITPTDNTVTTNAE